MKKFLVTLGVVLMLIGVATLIQPEVKMPSNQREVDVAGQKLIINTRRIVTVPVVLSGFAIVAGAGLVFVGLQKKKASETAKSTK
jgi:ribose/xylose/arabinose/galactoside ABC-type transport system permease subunit